MRISCRMSFCTDYLDTIGNTILVVRVMNQIITLNAMKYLVQLLSLVLIDVLGYYNSFYCYYHYWSS